MAAPAVGIAAVKYGWEAAGRASGRDSNSVLCSSACWTATFLFSSPERGAVDTTFAAKEETEQSKLAALWIGFSGVLILDSAMLSALSTSGFDHLRPLFLDRAASPLARHLRGWRVWMSFCANVGWCPGSPSLVAGFPGQLSRGCCFGSWLQPKEVCLERALEFELCSIQNFSYRSSRSYLNVLLYLPGGTLGGGSAIG